MHKHLWKPFAGALTRTRSSGAVPACASVRAHRAECASRKKSPTLTGAVFVLTAQALELLQENTHWYGVTVSGGLLGGINTYSYVEGDPLSKIDPNGEFAVVGAVIGAGFEVGMQAFKNYKNGCDLLNIDNYDLWDVGVAAAVGAFAPGMMSGAKGAWPAWVPFVGKSRGAGGAIKNLWEQLGRANTANRIAKIEDRLYKNGAKIADDLIYNTAYQAAKNTLKDADGSKNCSCK